MPSVLQDAYIAKLTQMDLLESACVHESGPIGGASKDDTLKHFAKRFTASVGRVQYTMLGDDNAFSAVSGELLTSFSSGHVALLDIPCGTGAMACALIANLIVLRESSLLPKLPLHISICAGDYSTHALEIYEDMIGNLASIAKTQGITLSLSTMEWDASNPEHMQRLVDTWFASGLEANEHVVVVTDFSGALKDSNLSQAFNVCFGELLSRLYKKHVLVVWIEPSSTKDGDRILQKVVGWFKTSFSWFGASHQTADARPSALFNNKHVLNDQSFRSGVCLEMFQRWWRKT